MKTKILTAVLAMFTVMSFSQGREIRKAGNAIEDGEFQEAKSHLSEAEAELGEADQDEQAEYYLFKGQAYLGTGQDVSFEDLKIAQEAFEKAAELGEGDEAQLGLKGISNALINLAIADQNSQKYNAAAEKLFLSYQLNKQDTLYLYYAASNAINAQDLDTALEHYLKLKDLGFTGIGTEYIAINKETGEEELMSSKEQMEIFIKSGAYTNPEVRKTKSKAGEIAKNIALIYIQKGEQEKAIAAMEAAKKANPEDLSLMQAEADLYYSIGDKEKYRELMEEIKKANPNDPILFYNLGVSSAELGDKEQAIKYYRRALEIDPSLANARINLAFMILSQEEALVTEMNSLGTTPEENKKYEKLSEERKQLYRDALPILLVAQENDPQNLEVARTLMNIYYQLDQPEKAEEMKVRIEELEAQ